MSRMAIPDSGRNYGFMPIEMNRDNKKINAVIIEDDIDTCFLLSRILVENKIKSLSVNSLHDAKNVFELVNPSWVFIDNNLSDGYGLNFLSYVRDKFPEAQIVMITAHNSESNKRKALLNGAGFFIAKPFSKQDISNVINSANSRFDVSEN